MLAAGQNSGLPWLLVGLLCALLPTLPVPLLTLAGPLPAGEVAGLEVVEFDFTSSVSLIVLSDSHLTVKDIVDK